MARDTTTPPAAAETPAPTTPPAPAETVSVCTECFPGGPPEGAEAVGCEHGEWTLTPAADPAD